MNKEYGFKLEKLVNNLNSNSKLSNTLKNLKHTINNSSFVLDAEEFYEKNSELMIDVAEENMSTIADLNNYVNWTIYDE